MWTTPSPDQTPAPSDAPPVSPTAEGLGWRQPRDFFPSSSTARLLVAGALINMVLGWFVLQLVASAWSACEDFGLGTRIGLRFFALPLLITGLWVAYVVGVVIGRSRSWPVRFATGLGLSLATAALFIAVTVPTSPGSTAYVRVDRDDYPECGSDGIPTWWPSWLPN